MMLRTSVIYILLFSIFWIGVKTAIAGPPKPVQVDKVAFQNQLSDHIIETVSEKVHELFYEGVDQTEVYLLQQSNFIYLLEDFKDLGIDPSNPQLSQNLQNVYKQLKERYDSGEQVSLEEVKGLLTSNWKSILGRLMDEESATIIDDVYNLAMDGWNKIKALEEITEAEEPLSEPEMMKVFRDWGVSGKFLDELEDLEVFLRSGYNYIAEPLSAAQKIHEAMGEGNPGRKIEILFELGNEYSGKIPIIGDLVKQIFVVGQAVLKAANELGGLLSRNLNQGCISTSGQFNIQNDPRAASFTSRFPNVERVCPFHVDLDGKDKNVPSIYKNTYYDEDSENHLYFYINDKWFKGKQSPKHLGLKDIRAIIGWLRNNGMADKATDDYFLFQMYNHSPGFTAFREESQALIRQLMDGLFGSQGIISTLDECASQDLKQFIDSRIDLDALDVIFSKKYLPGWDGLNDKHTWGWEEMENHLMMSNYNRFIKNSDYPPFTSARPIVELEELQRRMNFTPVKIWGTVLDANRIPKSGASIYFSRSSQLYTASDCYDKVTREKGQFRLFYLQSGKSIETVSVEAEDSEGNSAAVDIEIDLASYNTYYVTIELSGEDKDCPDGQVWNETLEDCELVCPGNSIDVLNDAGLVVDCECPEGYDWNEDQTDCILDDEGEDSTQLDCSIYPNMEEVWDDAQQMLICACISNHIPNPDGNGCIEKETVDDVDCSAYVNTEARIDPSTGGVVCDCVQGCVWKADQSGCITKEEDAINRADCSAYPNSLPEWNSEYDMVICDCAPGFEWNDDRTACVEDAQTQVANSDCSAFPNTRPVWSEEDGGVICDCISGYEWNDEYTLCVPDKNSQVRNADCSAYPNTRARWDDIENGVVCDCISGYEWNEDFTACEKKRGDAPDCAAYYPNTRAVWVKRTGEYQCECIKGYEWNENQSGCVMTAYTQQTQGATACRQYGPAVGKWNASRNAFDCYCKSGYVWNAAGTYCVRDPDRAAAMDDFLNAAGVILEEITGNSGGFGEGTPDNPVVAPEQQHEGKCNTLYGSGSDSPEQYSIQIPFGSATNYQFYYSHITVKDRTHVYYNGRKIFDSGCVSGSKTVDLNLGNGGGTVKVIVDPNCEGTSSTQWSIKLTCP